MTIRDDYFIEDVTQLIFALLSSKTSAPWSSWRITIGWPEVDVNSTTDKLVIYIGDIFQTESTPQQGGLNKRKLQMTIGTWDDRISGGTEEINIATSALLSMFNSPEVNSSQFTVTLGTTTYTSKTLGYHGLTIQGANGPMMMDSSDPKEFRRELTVFMHF